ncbi:MAG TPA: glycoside hydrolase family 44 protein [Candidatus Didemnitutus sp.]|nr:glycoside hydrolase family 44 protein [Candidatus Didemnitutus sp.]
MKTPALLLVLALLAPLASAQNAATSVNVDASASRHAINPNIYGLAYGDAHDMAALNTPLNRWGGNSTTRYNWQIDAHSAAADWYFETYSDGSGTPGGSADAFVATTRSSGNGAEPLFTIPMIDYLAKLGTNRSTLAGFSVKKYGTQTATDPYNSDAGNGVSQSTGKNITGNDPLDTGTANSTSIQQAWVQHFVNTYGASTAANGIKYYILDNEPSLWSSTHRDVHPSPVTYDELWSKIVAYATAIRAADPNAKIVGPEEWSWWAMYFSGFDQANGSSASTSDYVTHGHTYYYPWLLQQLAAYKQQHGVQLIDVFTVHAYNGAPDGGDDSLSGQQYRNKETRILWDPNFADPSWYGDIGINGRVINWIPTLKAMIALYCPGLQLGFTEYNWGDEANLNGATTQADVLGIYGREGLDLATRWTVAKNTNVNPTAYYVTYLASQIYRNYDGNKSGFGDTSVSATVANPDNLSAFAAVRSSDHALTVMVINKQQGSTPVTINLANFSAGATAQAWQVNSAAQTTIARLTDVAMSSHALTTTVPSQSITLFVIPAASGSTTAKIPDFNGDGKADVIWTNTGTGDRALWYLNGTAVGTFGYLAGIPTAWDIVGTADFDGDGHQDIAWENLTSGDRTVWLMNGTTIANQAYLAYVDPMWHIAALADLDGDGKTDLVWENTTTGDRAVWFLDGTAIKSFGYIAGISTDWHIVGAADFDGDGQNDLVWENLTTGDRTVWFMNGATLSSFGYIANVDPAWHIAMLSDFDGDGQTDILWENRTTGDRAIWLMHGTSLASQAYLAYVDPIWRIAP